MKPVLIQKKNLREGVRRERKDFLLILMMMTWRKVLANPNPANLAILVVDQCMQVKLQKLLDYKESQKSIVN